MKLIFKIQYKFLMQLCAAAVLVQKPQFLRGYVPMIPYQFSAGAFSAYTERFPFTKKFQIFRLGCKWKIPGINWKFEKVVLFTRLKLFVGNFLMEVHVPFFF